MYNDFIRIDEEKISKLEGEIENKFTGGGNQEWLKQQSNQGINSTHADAKASKD